MTVYKIRRKDGLFSEGGAAGPWVRFVKIGKTWNHLRHAIMHIQTVVAASRRHNKPHPYDRGCEIVEYTITESRTLPLSTTLKSRQKRPRTVVLPLR
jgi:hypothetical protein